MNPGSPTSLPLVMAEEFEGPLDLLLDEVRRQNVAIEKIAMAPIVARFLEYLRTAAERNLNLDIEWLHMAATLIQWKSRVLLPADATPGAPQDPIRDALIDQLVAHRKEAAADLARRRSLEEARFSRSEGAARQPAEAAEGEELPFLSVWDLIEQARGLSRWVNEYREDQHHFENVTWIEDEEITVQGMMSYLQDQLVSAACGLDGLQLVKSQPSSARRACLFLGMLEMCRLQRVELVQSEAFEPIWITLT